jgi:aminoglycoside phosphotransferase (APT) family kinase protein
MLSTPEHTSIVSMKALAPSASDKWAKATAAARAVTDAELRIVMRTFPDDAKLRGPRWLLEPERHAAACTALELPPSEFGVLAYKPERRFVAVARHAGDDVAVVKCYDDDGYARSKLVQAALSHMLQLPISRAVAWNDSKRTIAYRWIAGRMPHIPSEPLGRFEQAGELLARLHGAPIEIPGRDVADGGRTGLLYARARDTAAFLPDVLEPMRRVVARLEAHRSDVAMPHVPIHGDFYAKQLLVCGPDVALLDFDECAMGDPHADLAIFSAHLERDLLRGAYSRARADDVFAALLAGYRRLRPIDDARLICLTASSILTLAPHPFRHRDEHWPTLTRQLVDRAGALLDTLGPSAPALRRRLVRDVDAATSAAEATMKADESLRFAAELLDPNVAARALAERSGAQPDDAVTVERTTVLRHKAGRRCLIAFDVLRGGHAERWLGKVRARGVDWRATEVHRQLWSAGMKCIAEPLGAVPAMRMALQRAVDGTPLLHALNAGADPRVLGAAIARSLHALHTSSIEPARAWSVDDELGVLRTNLDGLAVRQPALCEEIARLQRRLNHIAQPLRRRTTRAVVHRDFYHDQVMADGDDCRLVDLDLVAIGDPALDIGNFMAHLIDECWRGRLAAERAVSLSDHLCGAYRILAPTAIDDDSLARHIALSLGRLVAIASIHSDRQRHLPMLLARLDARLNTWERSAASFTLPEGRQWYIA